MARQLTEINQEYTQICTRLGEAVYQTETAFPKLIDELKAKCSDLQEEGRAAIIAEQAAAAEAAKESANGQSDSAN